MLLQQQGAQGGRQQPGRGPAPPAVSAGERLRRQRPARAEIVGFFASAWLREKGAGCRRGCTVASRDGFYCATAVGAQRLRDALGGCRRRVSRPAAAAAALCPAGVAAAPRLGAQLGAQLAAAAGRL